MKIRCENSLSYVKPCMCTVSRSLTILHVTSENKKLLLSTVPVGIVRRMPQTPLLRPPRIFDGFLLDTFSKTPSNPPHVSFVIAR